MKKLRVIMFVSAIALMAAMMTGCPTTEEDANSGGNNNGGGDNNVAEMSAEEILAAAVNATASDVNTYAFDMDVSMVMTGETPGTVTPNSTGIVDAEAFQVYIDALMTVESSGFSVQMDMESYFVDAWMYTKVEMLGLPAQWGKMEAPLDYWSQASVADQQLDLMTGFVDVELLGTEFVNGVECYKLQVTPDMASLLAWAQTQEGTGDIEGLDSADVITEFTYTEWIAKDTFLIVKTDMEMTITVEGDSVTMATTVLMYDFNEAVAINLPAEALTAEIVPTS